MKDWFPFTNYDFYAYLTTGMLVIAAFDHVFSSGSLAAQDWTLISGFFWTAVAYLLGQIIAIPSSAIFEHGLARKFLRPPSAILLGMEAPRKRERLIVGLFGAREYAPLPPLNRERIMSKLASLLGSDAAAISAEAAFHCAFPRARSVADTAARLDAFLNQYGMARNVSFAATAAAVILAFPLFRTPDLIDVWLFVGAIVLAVGMFVRFIKFYAAYSREVFRTFAMIAVDP